MTFEITKQELVHNGPVVSTWFAHVRTPDGDMVGREIVRHPGAVAVVPVIDGHVVLIRQYRVAVDAVVLELPAGKLDIAGEDPAAAAARELEEETGFVAANLELMGSLLNSPGFCDERIHVYLAEDLSAGEPHADGAEEAHSEIVHIPTSDVRDMVMSGQVEDAKTLIGLQWMLLRQSE